MPQRRVAWLAVAAIFSAGTTVLADPSHPRTLTLRITERDGLMTFTGELADTAATGTSPCAAGAPVAIERASGANWVTAVSAQTGPSNPQGSSTYSAELQHKPGTYRAHVAAAGDCGEAISRTVLIKSRTAGPRRCTVSDHDGPGGLAEFDLTCARGIANGQVTFVVNRGGCDRGCNPKLVRPRGRQMFCSGRALGTPSLPSLSIGCEGSLPANTKLVVRQRFGKTSACDRPRFRGTYTVRFGNGTKLGPRRLPAFRCRARTFRRHFTNFFIGSEPGGGFGWVAGLRMTGRNYECLKGVPVLIQAHRGGSWKTIIRLRAPRHLNNVNEAQMHGQMPAGTTGPAGYRIVAPRVRFGNQVCARATLNAGP